MPLTKALNKIAGLFQDGNKFEWEYIGSSTERGQIPPWIWDEIKKLEPKLTLADEGRVWNYKGRTFRYRVVAVGLELRALRRLRRGKGLSGKEVL